MILLLLCTVWQIRLVFLILPLVLCLSAFVHLCRFAETPVLVPSLADSS